MSPTELPRYTAAAALGATALLATGALGPAALRGGAPGVAALALLLAPLALGMHGVLRARLRTGRWLSLALPFYGAGLLVTAVGNPGGRVWTTLGAFCVALGFAAILSWLRRAAPPAPTQ
jgi:uncharacterized membrane protein